MRPSLLILPMVAACTTAPKPRDLPLREPVPVAASFDQTWYAAISVLTQRGLPIRTVDKASGVVTTDALELSGDEEKGADCGSLLGLPYYPHRATFSVVVRGDSARSVAQVSARWVWVGEHRRNIDECASKGIVESRLESEIKTIAESAR